MESAGQVVYLVRNRIHTEVVEYFCRNKKWNWPSKWVNVLSRNRRILIGQTLFYPFR